jgi:elongation factor 1 alpha-like protein
VPAYPISTSPPSSSAHFSAADFFRDAPWLNIPLHRKAEIRIEPLYPRLGLMGGSPQSEGKVSKLAALAAARKKKESERKGTEKTTLSHTEDESSREPKPGSLTLLERLSSTAGKEPRPSGLSALAKENRLANRSARRRPSATVETPKEETILSTTLSSEEKDLEKSPEEQPPTSVDLRASPSTFASIIVGDGIHPTSTEPSHLSGKSFDVMRVYGQDFTEVFDFAGPSPDDVVLNAQSASKGLPVRGMR